MIVRRAALRSAAGLRSGAFPQAHQWRRAFAASGSSSSGGAPGFQAIAAYTPNLKPSVTPKPTIEVGQRPVYVENEKLVLDPAIQVGPLAIDSDVPEHVVQRGKVTIYQPAHFLGQSFERPNQWEINFNLRGSSMLNEAWKEPLMGWTSSRDPLRATQDYLAFNSKEAAIEYCQQMGYEYEVAKSHQRKHIMRVYADKFKSTKYLRDKKSPNPDED